MTLKALIRAGAAAAIAVALLASCAGKEEIPQQLEEKEEGYRPRVETVRMIFTTHLDGDSQDTGETSTKTTLIDGKKVLWDNDDAITIIAEDTRTRSTFSEISLSDDRRTATFSGETAPSDNYYAVYPAQEAQLATDFKTVTMDLPWSQKAVEGSFATGTNISMAKSTESGDLFFRNVGSLLYFTVKSSSKSIKAARLTADGGNGRSLTGRAAVEFDDAGIPFVSDMLSTCESVQLDGEIAVGSRYYFVIYPGEYSSLSISFISTDGNIATFSTSSVLTTNRGKVRNLGDFSIPDSKWESAGSNVYTRLVDASLPSDYSGDYLIVYEDGGIAFDGSRSTLDATGNGFAVNINDGTIPVTEESREKEFTVAAIEGGYSICSASGYYIGQNSNSNGLSANKTTQYANSISGTGTIISAGGAYMRYNAAKDQTRFRYFKSSTYDAQKAVVLYKRGSGSGITDPEQTAAQPKIFTEEIIDVPAAGESGTTPITLVDADEWNVSVSCSGCVTGATLSDDRSTISYIIRKNTTTSSDSGTIIVTLSKTGCSDIITSIEVNQEAGEEEEEASWVLVTDASSLKAGDIIVLASNGKKAVAGALSSSYLESVGATFSTDLKTITELPSTAVIFTLAGQAGAWQFSSSEGLLGTTAAKNVCWGSGTTTWTISIDSSGKATITSTSSSCGRLQYNSSDPRFTTYTSAQSAVQIYRSTNGHDDPPLQTPYATTLNDISDRTTSGATVSGSFFSGESAPTAAFFRYGASSDNLNQVKYAATPSSTSGSFSANISGLSENSWYWYQACISVGGTTYSGDICSFKTGTGSPSGDGKACRGWFELPAQKDDNHDGVDDSNSDFYYSWTMRADATTVRNFSSCYSKSMIHPVWVAAPMHKCYLGNSGRNDSYKDDPAIKCTQNSKFTGYTRGHMVGSSDRTVSVATNKQAFYYSNIGAQISSGFNTGGGAWNNLEDFTDGQMCSDTLYQVIGCIFETFTDKYGSTVAKKTGTGADGSFQVPTAWYKVLLRTKSGSSGKAVDQCSASELKCAAFILAHRSNASHKPTAKDMYTVAELEEMTGLTFFVNVPNAPKTTATASDWGL